MFCQNNAKVLELSTLLSLKYGLFFGSSWRFFNYNFKFNKVISFIFLGPFLDIPISIRAKYLVYYLNITQDTELYSCTYKKLSWEFPELCFILIDIALYWLVKMMHNALIGLARINEQIFLKTATLESKCIFGWGILCL